MRSFHHLRGSRAGVATTASKCVHDQQRKPSEHEPEQCDQHERDVEDDATLALHRDDWQIRERQEIEPSIVQRHPWPGNIRELGNALGSAALRGTEGVITAQDIPLGERQPRNSQIVDMLFSGSYDDAHDKLDRLLILRILDEVGGNISEAARRLGVGRKKLTLRMKALGLYSPE